MRHLMRLVYFFSHLLFIADNTTTKIFARHFFQELHRLTAKTLLSDAAQLFDTKSHYLNTGRFQKLMNFSRSLSRVLLLLLLFFFSGHCFSV